MQERLDGPAEYVTLVELDLIMGFYNPNNIDTTCWTYPRIANWFVEDVCLCSRNNIMVLPKEFPKITEDTIRHWMQLRPNWMKSQPGSITPYLRLARRMGITAFADLEHTLHLLDDLL